MFVSSLGLPSYLNVKPRHHFCVLFQGVPINTHLEFLQPRRRRITTTPKVLFANNPLHFHQSPNKPKSLFDRTVITRVTNGGGGDSVDATSQQQSSSPDVKEVNNSSSNLGDGYISLFVRMLGLDNDPLDREEAIVALWKYSLCGKKYVDNIMQFPGCINLTVNLLRSESRSTCEAAAGLLRSISLINVYRDLVAESGAIEEIAALLIRPSLSPEVKEQSICTLWNLSVDGKLREKIASTDILPILVKKYLIDDEDIRVKEAAGGVLANLALSQINHEIMVEQGVIPKLARLLKSDTEGSQVIRKEARNALLELCKDEYYKILVIEEGLIPVPLIGAEAYKSFKPGVHSWPSFPDGTEIERNSQKPSRFGASELLLGLNVNERNANIDEAKMNAILGRSRQQFLARIGAIEIEETGKESEASSGHKLTLMPWVDGVARLVLILELEDEVAISRAAESIDDAAINEEMRMAFREAGAVKHLVRLLGYSNQVLKLNVIRALERLSVSNAVCECVEAEGVVDPLLDTLKCRDVSENLMNKGLDILARIFDPSKAMRSKFSDGPVQGLIVGKATDLAEKEIQKLSNVVDSSAVARLVEILKTSPPNLQMKAASILEFVAITDPTADLINPVDIEAALDAVFRQRILEESDPDFEGKEPEKYAVEVEEAGLAISAASRLLTKLLDSDHLLRSSAWHFTELLRGIIKSDIPLHCKDWVAACLVKLGSLSGSPRPNLNDSINTEVTLYETVPRLIEQLKNTSSSEAAVVELNRIVSEGVVDSSRVLASSEVISALVKVIEGGGSERAVEAGLAILYNLSMETENHGEIVAAGAVPVLKRIVVAERPQWKKALHLLRTLPT